MMKMTRIRRGSLRSVTTMGIMMQMQKITRKMPRVARLMLTLSLRRKRRKLPVTARRLRTPLSRRSRMRRIPPTSSWPGRCWS